MTKRSLILIFLFAVFIRPLTSYAQADSTGRGFDASKFSMQKRFRPKNAHEFQSSRFMDNVFFSGSLGGYYSFRTNYSSGTRFYVSAGKWFNAFNAARLTFGGGGYLDNYDAKRVSHFDLKASYLFNVTGYLNGYNPDRFAHLYALAGFGASFLTREGLSGLAPSAHMGFNASFRLYKGLSLFIEPTFDISKDAFATKRDDNWRKYVPALDIKVGISYDLFNADISPETYRSHIYYFLSGGAQIQNSALVQKGGKLMNALGGAANLGIGFQCLDWLDLRASVFGSFSLWDGDTSLMRKSTIYGGVRAEAIFVLLSVPNSKGLERFSIGILIGPEFGYMYKKDTDVTISSLYAGATAGFQFKCRVSNHLAIFLEPRATFVPYPAYTDSFTTINTFRNYYDGLLNLCIGIEYHK